MCCKIDGKEICPLWGTLNWGLETQLSRAFVWDAHAYEETDASRSPTWRLAWPGDKRPAPGDAPLRAVHLDTTKVFELRGGVYLEVGYVDVLARASA